VHLFGAFNKLLVLMVARADRREPAGGSYAIRQHTPHTSHLQPHAFTSAVFYSGPPLYIKIPIYQSLRDGLLGWCSHRDGTVIFFPMAAPFIDLLFKNYPITRVKYMYVIYVNLTI
jgi:hypothetical protein